MFVLSPFVLGFILVGPLIVTVWLLKRACFQPEALFACLGWPCRDFLTVLTQLGFIMNAVLHGLLGLYVCSMLHSYSSFWQAFFLWGVWTALDLLSAHNVSNFKDWGRRDCFNCQIWWYQFIKFLVTIAFASFMANNVIPQVLPMLGFIVIWHLWTWILASFLTWQFWFCGPKRSRHC